MSELCLRVYLFSDMIFVRGRQNWIELFEFQILHLIDDLHRWITRRYSQVDGWFPLVDIQIIVGSTGHVAQRWWIVSCQRFLDQFMHLLCGLSARKWLSTWNAIFHIHADLECVGRINKRVTYTYLRLGFIFSHDFLFVAGWLSYPQKELNK